MSVDTPADSQVQTRPERPGTPAIVRAIGVLLCLAAGLRLFDLFDSYGEGIGWTLSLIGSAVELLLGTALVLRAWPSISEPLAGLLFVLLAAISLIGTARGAEHCGCLGTVPTPPWVLLIFDAAAAVVLLWGPRTSDRYRGQPFVKLDAACIAAFFIGTTIGSAIYPRYVPITKNISREIIAASRIFTIDPDRFRGQPFHLAPFIRINADLSRGPWKVILTKPGCRKCDRRIGSEGCLPEGDERIAVVVARGPGERDRQWTLPGKCQATLGELSPDKTWDFNPPLVFRLKDGKVVDAR